jgi:hypothetical protein
MKSFSSKNNYALNGVGLIKWVGKLDKKRELNKLPFNKDNYIFMKNYNFLT